MRVVVGARVMCQQYEINKTQRVHICAHHLGLEKDGGQGDLPDQGAMRSR